ncbi:MAG TPA: NepR family anti-sigma factor [Methylocella sp.]|nr:NepR family anti-sigma factor [Methylocella sp.]
MTRPVKPKNPSTKTAEGRVVEAPRAEGKPLCPEPKTLMGGGPCPRKPASKSEIADQIGMQLRSIYDDVLAQPVPGRFLDLLQQLECTSGARLSKDGV